MNKIMMNNGIDRLLVVVGLMVSVAILTACGQKGVLVLPLSAQTATSLEANTISDDVAQ